VGEGELAGWLSRRRGGKTTQKSQKGKLRGERGGGPERRRR